MTQTEREAMQRHTDRRKHTNTDRERDRDPQGETQEERHGPYIPTHRQTCAHRRGKGRQT